jgi:hypothetical protein
MGSFIKYVLIRMVKLKRMRWAGHVARLEGMKNAYKCLVG